MHPVLFEFGPIKIYSYGLLVALAFIVSTHLAQLEAKRQGVSGERILSLCLGLVIFGILGGRSLYILENLRFYLEHPQQIFMLPGGGLSFYGGFILAIVFACIYLKRAQLPVFATLDLICPYLALAQAIGRIGCFLNGCCYGWPIGQTLVRHPVQLYSSLTLLLIFILLRTLQTRKDQRGYFPGQLFLTYCLLYSAARFFLEYFRADHAPLWPGLTSYQLFSLIVFATSLTILIRGRLSPKR